MSQLSKLSDQDLIEATDRVVAQEREALLKTLEHLREIERRRLYSSLGYTSLWNYAVKRLKYSEDQAWRRISAMRMLKELPEIEAKIESGSLTLTNLGLAQSLFRAEEKSEKPLARQEKTALLEKLENKSKREAEQIILKQSAQAPLIKPDRVQTVSDDLVKIQFTADQQLLDKIELVKGLMAHTHPDLTLAELMNHLCDLALKKLNPARPVRRSPAPARVTKSKKRVAISHPLRREVWQNAKGQCAQCGSRRALQIEHIHPVAWGGTNDRANLTLLCRPCNQRSAIAKFGVKNMEKYILRSRLTGGFED